MQTSRFRVMAAICLAWCLIGLRLDISADGLGESSSDVVEIRLRSTAETETRIVTLGTVAELQGGSELLRSRLAQIDLGEIPSEVAKALVKKRQVDIRLRLAEFPKQLYRITGNDECIVHLQKTPITRERIWETVRQATLKYLPWPENELALTLAQPISANLPSVESGELQIKVTPHYPEVKPGRVQMDVTILQRGEQKLTFPVYLNVQLVQRVVMARRSLSTGEILIEDNTLIDRRPVDAQTKAASPDQLMGKRLKRPISAGQVLTLADILEEPVAPKSVAIKARQPIKIMVRAGGLLVGVNGESMQDGKVGDVIVVRYVESKKQLSGRVTAPGVVELE